MRQDQTDFVILGLLNHEPMTGYDIKKRIDGSIQYFWNAGFGQIYPALKRLEERKFVAKKEIHGNKTPDRKLYSITSTGSEALLGWLNEPASKEYMRFEILLKLFFGSAIGPLENINRIEDFRARYQKIQNTMLLFEKDLKKNINDSPDHLYYLLTVLFGKKLYSAYVEWADEAELLLKKSIAKSGKKI
jgi:DNA-binding PadR family transcriptional regulator